MREIALEFNFSKVPTELAGKILTAIQEGLTFGLTNERGAVNVFYTKERIHHTASSRSQNRVSVFKYENDERMFNGISLALLTCKQFIPQTDFLDAQQLLKYD